MPIKCLCMGKMKITTKTEVSITIFVLERMLAVNDYIKRKENSDGELMAFVP